MKTILRNFNIVIVIILLITNTLASNAQSIKKHKLTVLYVDSQGIDLTPEQMGNLLRIEVEKLDTFEVMDRYDVAYMIKKHQLDISDCYGKICLTEVGSIIKADKMLTGSVELYGETIIITLRLIDVAEAQIEKTFVKEYLNLPKEIQTMVMLSVRELFGKTVNQELITQLTKKFNYDNATTNPDQTRINNSGPRMGFTVFTGTTADRLKEKKNEGGYDVNPIMFQFGYQVEAQYLNQGNFQALFEFIPLVTGLDQGMFIPSFTIMNGLRNNKNGFEFAFGPTASLAKVAKGYYDKNNNFILEGQWTSGEPIPELEERFDSRGEYALNTGFIFAMGKTFKSGKLNIPVNAYIIPHKDGFRFGASFGYNAKK